MFPALGQSLVNLVEHPDVLRRLRPEEGREFDTYLASRWAFWNRSRSSNAQSCCVPCSTAQPVSGGFVREAAGLCAKRQVCALTWWTWTTR